MQPLKYTDLELKIQRRGDREYYVLAKSRTGEPEATGAFVLPFSRRELSLILTTLRGTARNYQVLRSVAAPH